MLGCMAYQRGVLRSDTHKLWLVHRNVLTQPQTRLYDPKMLNTVVALEK
jgi:hypothetical protein